MSSVRRIELPVPGIDDLAADARGEGYAFIDRLLREWASGENRFDADGEVLCGVFDKGCLVAIGGLNIDPFLRTPEIGRVRRIYVRPQWRKLGIGEALVLHLLREAGRTFRKVRLNAENGTAARLYERLGFNPIEDPHATHIFELSSNHPASHYSRDSK